MQSLVVWYAQLPLITQFLLLLFCFLAALQIVYHVWLTAIRIYKKVQQLIQFGKMVSWFLIQRISQKPTLFHPTIPPTSDFLTPSDLKPNVRPSEQKKPLSSQAKKARTQPRDAKGRFVKQDHKDQKKSHTSNV